MSCFIGFCLTEVIVINDDDSLRTEQLPTTEADLEVEHECEHALNLQKVFSENVVDSVVDKVVHKIQKYVQPDVVEPDVQPKEHDVSKTGSTEDIQQKHGIVCRLTKICEFTIPVKESHRVKFRRGKFKWNQKMKIN